MITDFRKKYFFLSNFYPCKVNYNGIVYLTSEAAYQAQKTLDMSERIRFSGLDAESAKQEGQKVSLREDWEDVKLNIMYEVCKAKFKQNPELAQRLIDTGNEELVEGNDWNDSFWGVCNGTGTNYLGKILMLIRNEIH